MSSNLGPIDEYPGHFRRIHIGCSGFMVDHYTGKMLSWPKPEGKEWFILVGVVYSDGEEILFQLDSRSEVNAMRESRHDFHQGIIKLYGWRPKR